MSKHDEKECRIGPYYLRRRSDNSIYEICWADRRRRANGQRRISTGKRDFGEAERELQKFFIQLGERTPQAAKSVTLDEIISTYLLRDGVRFTPSGRITARSAARRWREFFGAGFVISDLTLDLQREFIAEMSRDRNRGTVKRIYGFGVSAIRRAHKPHNLLDAVPDFIEGRELPDSSARDRVFSKEEFLAFWYAIDSPHLARFVMLGMNTAARPNALLALSIFQIRQYETHTVVDLHPAGTKRTVKVNATVRVSETLRPWLQNIDGPLVVGRQRKVLYASWRDARQCAGLDAELVPYTMRHTVQTLMDERGVSEREMDDFLGHKRGSRMSEHYLTRRPIRPEYLHEATQAIDDWFADVEALNREKGRVSARPFSPETHCARTDCVPEPKSRAG